MLVLTRREGESLRVGPDVRITVVTIGSGQVRIGIEAPEAVWIHRDEVFARLEACNREAARAAASTTLPPPAAGRRDDETAAAGTIRGKP